MREPVNIMGVIAFPNPNGERSIRFIDSSYNELFRVPDGSNITVTGIDGSHCERRCTYIDDCHAKIGYEVYHICEFAERMEQVGCTYVPEGGDADTYEIYQIADIGGVDYCFRDYASCSDRVNAADYRRVYAGMLSPTLTLGAIYQRHNRDDRPFGRRMRSLSVSDVIVTKRSGERKAYYVDSIGFTELLGFLP